MLSSSIFFRYFFCLKKEGGAGGSKIAGGVYLNLRDGMKTRYLHVPLNTLMRGWYKKWFYVMQEAEPLTACDVAHVPETQEAWLERPNSSEMEQVKELLGLIDKATL